MVRAVHALRAQDQVRERQGEQALHPASVQSCRMGS